MPVSIIAGGQFGSEGKGKVAAIFSENMHASIVIRCGGSNSGHTVYSKTGQKFIFRQLPTACIQPGVKSMLASGSYIDVDVLINEINISDIKPENLCIDPKAVIIDHNCIKAEEVNRLRSEIGSTGSGTGQAVAQRVSREKKLTFAKDIKVLQPYLCDTQYILEQALRQGERIIIEGTQGYGLSVLHSDYYPYVTSRDTTAAGFISECGISPLDVDDIILVIRSFPIRVSGNSGPLSSEIDWETVSSESGSDISIKEFTSVTNKLRRVGRFDSELVKKAIQINKPSRIVLNHVDYIALDQRLSFISEIERQLDKKIDYVGESHSTLSAN